MNSCSLNVLILEEKLLEFILMPRLSSIVTLGKLLMINQPLFYHQYNVDDMSHGCIDKSGL